MPREDKFAVNPYLFLLLKEMLAYEIVYFFDTNTELNACKYFYVANKKPFSFEKFQALIDAQLENKKFPKGTSSFKRHIWNQKTNFCFTTYRLDMLARSILFLGEYDSWDDFVKENDNSNSIPCHRYKKMTYKELKERDVLSNIRDRVMSEIISKCTKAKNSGIFKGEKYHVIHAFSEGAIIRNAVKKDFTRIEELKSQFQKNKDILNNRILERKFRELFFVLVNPYNEIVVHFGILPSTSEFIDSLVKGDKTIADFNYFDLLLTSRCPNFLFVDFVCADQSWGGIIQEQIWRVIEQVHGLDGSLGSFNKSLQDYTYSISVYAENTEPYNLRLDINMAIVKRGLVTGAALGLVFQLHPANRDLLILTFQGQKK